MCFYHPWAAWVRLFCGNCLQYGLWEVCFLCSQCPSLAQDQFLCWVLMRRIFRVFPIFLTGSVLEAEVWSFGFAGSLWLSSFQARDKHQAERMGKRRLSRLSYGCGSFGGLTLGSSLLSWAGPRLCLLSACASWHLHPYPLSLPPSLLFYSSLVVVALTSRAAAQLIPLLTSSGFQ